MTAAGEVRLYMTLQKAAHALKKKADAALLEAADMTTAQAAVLVAIRAQKGATQRSVAEALGLNESAVTAMIRKLVERGLVSRSRSQVDARAWSLALTPEGDATLNATRGPFEALNQTLDEELGPESVRFLALQLEQLSKVLRT